MRIFFGAVALVSALPGIAAAELSCAGEVCVDTNQTNAGVSFHVINRTEGLPVTVTFDLTLTNMRVGTGSSDPVVVPGGGQPIYLFDLVPGGSGSWSWNYTFTWVRGDFRAVHDDQHLYSLPYPTDYVYEVSQGCDGDFSHFEGERYAVDFNMRPGSPIAAMRAGQVVDVIEEHDQGGPSEDFRAYTNEITILHEDRTHAIYSHLRQNGAEVEIGDYVEAGQLIAYSGGTGYSTGPHLHVAVAHATLAGEETSVPITFDTHSGLVRCPAVSSRLRAN